MKTVVALAIGIVLGMAGPARASVGYSANPSIEEGKVKPAFVGLPRTADSWLDGVAWNDWGGSTATGKGSFVFRAPVPTKWPADVRLSTVRSCLGQKLYTRLAFSFPGDKPWWLKSSGRSLTLHCPPVYYWGPGLKPRLRPRTLYFGANGYVKSLKWRNWTKGWRTEKTVSGRGSIPLNNCEPNCAQGRVRLVPASVSLSSQKYCDAAGHYVFRRTTIRYAGRRLTLSIPPSSTLRPGHRRSRLPGDPARRPQNDGAAPPRGGGSTPRRSSRFRRARARRSAVTRRRRANAAARRTPTPTRASSSRA